jgi:hypothetical protein
MARKKLEDKRPMITTNEPDGYEDFCRQMERDLADFPNVDPAVPVDLILPADNTPLPIAEANTTAHADAALAPPEVILEKEPARDKKRRKSDREFDAVKSAQAKEQWETVTRLHAEGKGRPEISKITGLTYGRLTFILWHKKWGVDAIPGMVEYSAARKADAQRRYDADVIARREG